MLRSFFVASLLLVMILGISEPAAALQTQRASIAHAINPLDAQNCSVYPIAINVTTVANVQPGDNLGDIYNGAGPGNFGWLRWNDDAGSNTASYLADELQDPTLSFTEFEEANLPGDDADHYLNAGDWVWALIGINNSSEMRDTLTGLVDAGTTLRMPVWDVAQGEGYELTYHIQRFVFAQLTDFDLTDRRLSLTFMGEDPAACPEPADLTIAKSASSGEVSPGQTLTYTLAFSNMGAGPATGVAISDTLPLVLTDAHFTSAGALITPTSGVTYAWQVQDLAQNEGGTITVTGQVRSDLDGGFTFTNTSTITGTSVESDAGNNVSTAAVWVSLQVQPLIFSLNGTTFEVNTTITVLLDRHLPNAYYDIYLGSTVICTNVQTNRLGIWEGNCLIPADLAPGTYELTSTVPGSGTEVAGNVFVTVTCMACPTLSIRDGNQWPAGSPIVLQLRRHAPHTVHELYFNSTLIGTTGETDAYGDVDLAWIIPAATPPRESPSSYRFESHLIVSPFEVAHADIYVTTPQIVVLGGNTWPAGTTLQASLRRHAPNHAYEVRCNGVPAGTSMTDSEGSSIVGVACTIPITAPVSPPYYTIKSYDASFLIGQVDATVLAPRQIHLPVIFKGN